MIKAVIFDCFGVLTRDGWIPFQKKYFEQGSEQSTDAGDLNKQSNAGLISYDDFLGRIAEMSGMTHDQARKEIETNPVDLVLFEAIRVLKHDYKIGMLSNASDYHLNDIFTKDQIDLFDEIVLSYQVGAVKPATLMYQTVADRLGALPEECIFIDDQERYVTAAREFGMKGIVFENTESTLAKIKELLHA